MFIVPPSVQQARMSKCRECKFHKDTPVVGVTCGTFITGGEVPDENKVTHYRKKIRLCGCKMSWKTKYALAKCPIGTWGVHNLTEEQIEHLENFLASIKGKSTVSSEQVQTLFKWKSRATGKYEQPQYCGQCVTDLIRDMQEAIDKMKLLNPTK